MKRGLILLMTILFLTSCTKIEFDSFNPATSTFKWTITNEKTDAAYIAGLFDADGCVSYKKYKCADKRYKDSDGNVKKYWMWDIRLEIAMTHESVVRWVHEVVGLGTVTKKPPHKTSLGKKCNTDGVVAQEKPIKFVVYVALRTR